MFHTNLFIRNGALVESFGIIKKKKLVNLDKDVLLEDGGHALAGLLLGKEHLLQNSVEQHLSYSQPEMMYVYWDAELIPIAIEDLLSSLKKGSEHEMNKINKYIFSFMNLRNRTCLSFFMFVVFSATMVRKKFVRGTQRRG